MARPNPINRTYVELRAQLDPVELLDLAEDILDGLFNDPAFHEAADPELLAVVDLCLDALDDQRFGKENPGGELARRFSPRSEFRSAC